MNTKSAVLALCTSLLVGCADDPLGDVPGAFGGTEEGAAPAPPATPGGATVAVVGDPVTLPPTEPVGAGSVVPGLPPDDPPPVEPPPATEPPPGDPPPLTPPPTPSDPPPSGAPSDPEVDPSIPAPEPEPPSVEPAVTVLVSDTWSEDPVPTDTGSEFPLYATSDLSVYVFFRDWTPGVHLIFVEFVAPGGGVYQTDPLAYAVGPTDVPYLTVEGLWTPVWVWPAVETDLGWRADDWLAVAGTTIASHVLTGTWMVRVYEGSTATAPVAQQTFDFVP